MSAYGPKADHLGASATGPNMAVFEQDKSASPELAQAEWDARQLLNRAISTLGKESSMRKNSRRKLSGAVRDENSR